jgi:hypothetical protein
MSARAMLVAMAAIAAIPATAVADPSWMSGHTTAPQKYDHCPGRWFDDVVGYACHPMSRWSPGASGWLDLGTGWFRLSDDTLASSRGGVAASGHVLGGNDAGGFARIGVDLPSGRYFVTEADFAGAGTTNVMLDASPATAHVIYAKLDVGLGQHVHLGGVTLGAELAPGIRFWSYNLPGTGGSPTDIKPALDIRARAETWLGPWATGGVQASADVVDSQDASVTLYLGFHLNAYDGR